MRNSLSSAILASWRVRIDEDDQSAAALALVSDRSGDENPAVVADHVELVLFDQRGFTLICSPRPVA